MTTNAELKRLAEAIGGETWFQPDEGCADVWSCDPETDSEYPIRKRHAFNPQPSYESVPHDEWYDAEQKLSDYITAANPARIIALVDEVERLRGALNGIVDGDADYLTDAQNIARQALTTGEGPRCEADAIPSMETDYDRA